MIVVANGKEKAVASGATVKDFLDQLQLAPERIVVEYNGEPLQREQFSRTPLHQGDALEIAHMVGGG